MKVSRTYGHGVGFVNGAAHPGPDSYNNGVGFGCASGSGLQTSAQCNGRGNADGYADSEGSFTTSEHYIDNHLRGGPASGRGSFDGYNNGHGKACGLGRDDDLPNHTMTDNRYGN